ncbi:MFS-type transporter SLC18B1 isoform X2 [Halyomorpha halys]|uniref:MFS-type transporter SLC18B1 isoform X2 n=1 Tax=Halyomorpha halys TaxID=286706 RepID=UPI0006D4C964|nr:MFS-type transporter SLC18B1 [Halyomorpha halys]
MDGDPVRNHTRSKRKPHESKKSKRLSKSQWMTLIAIGSVHFSGAICISLQAPFYPQEAESKGATATEYGLVFGSFEFVAFLCSPVIGKYMHWLGVKPTLNLGMVLAGISAILFGLLDLIMSHGWFISLSFLLRMTESLGSTSALVSAFAITAAVFPDSVATTFATLEVFYGLGYIVGPTLGGLIFSVGGYKLPFLVMGSTMFIAVLFVYIILPPIKNIDTSSSNVGIRDILKVPAVVIDSLSVVGTSISMGFLAATLEPHIREFELTPVSNGLMFIISGGTYAVTAPFIGRICDKWVYPKRVLSVGNILIILSYCIIGPLPYLPIPKTLEMCIFGLIIHGFGLACLMVPTFIDSISSAIAAGFPDDLTSYGLVSGLWSSSFALGAFVGPSVSGLLYDLVGFQYGTFFVIIIHSFLFVGITMFIIAEKKPNVPEQRIRLLSHIDLITSDEEGFKSEEDRFNKKMVGYGTITYETKE